MSKKVKMLVLVALATLVGANAFGATIKSARLDAEKKNILVDVVYGGGCGKHQFSLKMGACMEMYPVQCRAELIEKTNDTCEALIHTTVVLSLAAYGLTDPYFKGGSLEISGDMDWQTNQPSAAVVRLPK